MPGWEIELLQDNVVLSSTITNQDGDYSFEVAPGTYQIREENKNGWQNIYPLQVNKSVGSSQTVTVNFLNSNCFSSFISIVPVPCLKNCDECSIIFTVQDEQGNTLGTGSDVLNNVYDFIWSTGQETPLIQGVKGETYSVTVSSPDDNCTLTQSITLSCDEEPIKECLTPRNPHCFSTGSGFFSTSILAWEAVMGATAYEILIAHDDPSCCKEGDSFGELETVTVTENQYTIPQSADYSKCFSWKVRAVCGGGNESPYTVPMCYSPRECRSFIPIRPGKTIPFFEQEIEIYPNPSNGLVHLAINWEEQQTTNAYIYDIKGRLVESFKVNGNNVIQKDLSHLRKGLYYIQMINEKGNYVNKKIIIQ